ncbi:MAG: hypothetical protein V7K94_17780 [Nostoc sp.]
MKNVDAERLAAGYRKGRIRVASRREEHKERKKIWCGLIKEWSYINCL